MRDVKQWLRFPKSQIAVWRRLPLLLGSLQEAVLLLKADEGKMQSPLEVQGVISGSVFSASAQVTRWSSVVWDVPGATNKQGGEQRETE